MKIRGGTWMSIGLMVISGYVFVTALKWPLRTAVFPMTIAVAVFLMAALDVFITVFIKHGEKEQSTMDFKLTGAEDLNIDKATATKRVFTIFLWILLFFALILLVGFPATIPIFFVAFLRIYGKESWKMTVVLSGAAWLFFYGFFVRFLHIPFAEGWVQQGLRYMGMLK